jgi:hypothetical protein
MKKSPHPDRKLFEYAAGILEQGTVAKIEDHLSECPECKLFSQSLLAIRSWSRRSADSHPSVGELASFFHASSKARRSPVAAHLATCSSCAEEVAQYATGESAAARYQVSAKAAGEVPAAAWDLIRDWEDSAFAQPKDESQIASGELLSRLTELLRSQHERPTTKEHPDAESGLEAVTVIDRSGTFRAVELFQRVAGGLRHTKESDRYDNKPVHALLDFGGGELIVLSDKVRGDRIELRQEAYKDKDLLRADYFIVED